MRVLGREVGPEICAEAIRHCVATFQANGGDQLPVNAILAGKTILCNTGCIHLLKGEHPDGPRPRVRQLARFSWDQGCTNHQSAVESVRNDREVEEVIMDVGNDQFAWLSDFVQREHMYSSCTVKQPHIAGELWYYVIDSSHGAKRKAFTLNYHHP